MAGTFCPDWIFNLSVARTAFEFIISDLPMKAYAKKYSTGLSEHYSDVNPEELENEAELLLRFLVEINAEKSDELLNNFIFFTLKYSHPGSKRKLKGLFGSAFDPLKEKKYASSKTLKSFRAYVFGLRSGVSEKPDPGWDILKEEEDLDFLMDILKKEANIVDGV